KGQGGEFPGIGPGRATPPRGGRARPSVRSRWPSSHRVRRPRGGPLRAGTRADARGLRSHLYERMFDPVDRFYELENWRRSLVMLPPGSLALDREDAVALIAELQEAEGQLRGLRDALKLLLPM